MAEKTEDSKPAVPYIPFKTFKAFIEKLNGAAVPPSIDASILTNLSGSMRGSLMSTLRSMDLVDASGAVHDDLRNLVKSYKTNDWSNTLSDIVYGCFSDIVGDVDLDNGTMAQLNEAFRQQGKVDGQMGEKAIRFYLSALREAGATYSPHFKERKPRASRKSAKKKKRRHSGGSGADAPEIETPLDSIRIGIPIPGKAEGVLYLPDDLTNQEIVMAKEITEFILQKYIASRPEAEE